MADKCHFVSLHAVLVCAARGMTLLHDLHYTCTAASILQQAEYYYYPFGSMGQSITTTYIDCLICFSFWC